MLRTCCLMQRRPSNWKQFGDYRLLSILDLSECKQQPLSGQPASCLWRVRLLSAGASSYTAFLCHCMTKRVYASMLNLVSSLHISAAGPHFVSNFPLTYYSSLDYHNKDRFTVSHISWVPQLEPCEGRLSVTSRHVLSVTCNASSTTFFRSAFRKLQRCKSLRMRRSVRHGNSCSLS